MKKVCNSEKEDIVSSILVDNFLNQVSNIMYLTFGITFSFLHSSESDKTQNNPSYFRYVSLYYAIYKQILCFDVKKNNYVYYKS